MFKWYSRFLYFSEMGIKKATHIRSWIGLNVVLFHSNGVKQGPNSATKLLT